MKHFLRIAISIGVSLLILGLLLQLFTSGLAEQQRPSVIQALQSTQFELLLGFLLLYFVALLLRALRYRLLLRVSGEPNVPTLPQMALVTGIRNMVVDMLPARLGELGYVGLLNRGYGVKLEHCVSSLTIAIAFDLVALLVVVLLVVVKQLLGSGVEPWALATAVSVLGVSAIAIFGLFLIAPKITAWASLRLLTQQVDHEAGKVERLWQGLVRLARDFGNSVVAVRASGATTQVLGLSVLIRLLKYLSIYLVFIAVAAPSFPALANLSVEKVVTALIGGELGASLPIPTFMSFGAYEAGSTLVFQLLGVGQQAQAFVTMLCVHIWSQLMEYIIGGSLLVMFIMLHRRARRQQVAASEPGFWQRWVSRASAAAVLMAGSVFLALELRAAKKLGAINAPETGEVVKVEQQPGSALDLAEDRQQGFVVFSSNRDGNHDIFRYELADQSLSKLTTHPHTETYPRISPDGQQLVFSRAHQPWVSQRNLFAWDIYLLNLVTGEETRVGQNGTSPQWISETEIIYLQQATRVVRVNVQSGDSSTVFESGVNNSMSVGAQIHNPKFNPLTGQVAFTARQSEIGINTGHWGTAIATGADIKGLYNGCEISWTTDGEKIFQVTTGGRDNGSPTGGLRIISIDPQSFESKTLIDLDGEFSHEYWPKNSNDGNYIVFGASRGSADHEHDTKDYEIFLWQVGSDAGTARRITYHTGNDNWPDVYIPE
ncbi:MAG: lysylphosphatidylglycerol synthase domain-containing protein [Pseudomonadota bacterium]